jgi:hypothetical protein
MSRRVHSTPTVEHAEKLRALTKRQQEIVAALEITINKHLPSSPTARRG